MLYSPYFMKQLRVKVSATKGGELTDSLFCLIWATVAYIESRVKGDIDAEELARSMGFSLPHLRELFAKHTGMPLSRYILTRRVANAAFALLHSTARVSDIATEYGFACHDTFTRAFRRVTGMTPTQFRKVRPAVTRIKLCAGVYGAGLPDAPNALHFYTNP